MSSDESTTEKGETVYVIKVLPWHHEVISHIMEMLEEEIKRDKGMGKNAGLKPVGWQRKKNIITARQIIKKLL